MYSELAIASSTVEKHLLRLPPGIRSNDMTENGRFTFLFLVLKMYLGVFPCFRDVRVDVFECGV